MNATASGTASIPDLPVPARLQKASLDDEALILELYLPATKQKRWLAIGLGTLALVEARPLSSAAEEGRAPPPLQGLVRKEAVPSTLTAITGTAVVHLVLDCGSGRTRTIVVERAASDPRVVLCAVTGAGPRVLAVLLGAPRAKDGRDLRRGQVYVESVEVQALVESTGAAPGASKAAAPDPKLEVHKRLRAEKKRLERLVKAIEGDLAKHGDPEDLERDGEILKTALGRIARGATSIDLVDFEGRPRTIALDPKLDAKGNLALLFKRAKKARTAIEKTEVRLAMLKKQLGEVSEALLLAIEDPERARAAVSRLDGTSTSSPKRAIAKAQKKRLPWRSFQVSRDVIVRVGRGGADNDALVKSARGHDLWLHAREKAGAHVIIPSRGDDVPPDVMLDAAHLAAHFSSARGEAHVDVQHSRVKHLKKPPGAPAGLFLVPHETVLHLRVDESRVQALLAREVVA